MIRKMLQILLDNLIDKVNWLGIEELQDELTRGRTEHVVEPQNLVCCDDAVSEFPSNCWAHTLVFLDSHVWNRRLLV